MKVLQYVKTCFQIYFEFFKKRKVKDFYKEKCGAVKETLQKSQLHTKVFQACLSIVFGT